MSEVRPVAELAEERAFEQGAEMGHLVAGTPSRRGWEFCAVAMSRGGRGCTVAGAQRAGRRSRLLPGSSRRRCAWKRSRQKSGEKRRAGDEWPRASSS